MELHYFIPFKAQGGTDAQFALREHLLNIEGTAIDTSVNANKWQVPAEDLEFLTQGLINAQLRIDHAESAMAVIGKVPEAKLFADLGQVWFRAEIGDLPIIERVLKGYLDHVSIQIDSDDVQCSKCLQQTRKEGMLVHLCPDAWEIVHKPKVRELSIVASPAYKNTDFKPVGFAAAMDASQTCKTYPCTGSEGCGRRGSFVCALPPLSPLSQGNKDVGSKGDLQEPENEKKTSREVNSLPEQQTAQQASSPHKAQGVVNTNNGQGESAPSQVNYADFMKELEGLQNQIASDDAAEADAMRAKIAALQKQVANRATKQQLGKKISDLQQQLDSGSGAAEDAEEPDGDEDGTTNENLVDTSDDGAVSSKTSHKATGKGMIGTDAERNQPGMAGETTMSVFGNIDWFKDVAKATAKLKGMR
ncbi:MAG: hypothetical protein ABSB89_05200 [Candidatus Bathyarchaeia archaeon]|jgi:hypothetical protein